MAMGANEYKSVFPIILTGSVYFTVSSFVSINKKEIGVQCYFRDMKSVSVFSCKCIRANLRFSCIMLLKITLFLY